MRIKRFWGAFLSFVLILSMLPKGLVRAYSCTFTHPDSIQLQYGDEATYVDCDFDIKNSCSL